MNPGLGGSVNTGYLQATTPLLQFNGQFLAGMTPDELNRVKSQYASVELSDGSNVTAMATIGAIRDQTSSSSSTWRKATTTFAAASHFMDERLPSCEATTATAPGKRRHVTAADW